MYACVCVCGGGGGAVVGVKGWGVKIGANGECWGGEFRVLYVHRDEYVHSGLQFCATLQKIEAMFYICKKKDFFFGFNEQKVIDFFESKHGL